MTTLPKPSTELLGRSSIAFCHPGYPAPNILLLLPRVDSAPDGTFGVHHRTALVACQIIANNAFSQGFLTSDVEGRQRVSTEVNEILTAETYYFRIENGPGMNEFLAISEKAVTKKSVNLDRYPIVPSFRDWQFPHREMPESWHEASGNISPSGRCAISNNTYALQRCHLVPKEEAVWFARNSMRGYVTILDDCIDTPGNLVSLRSDLHKCFDGRWFAFVPKAIGTAGPQYVTHLLVQGAAELWPLYHNVIVQSFNPKARAFLFARFAWAIFQQVKAFITDGCARWVIQVYVDNEGQVESRAEFLQGPELRNKYGGGGSKGSTPMGRKRAREGSAADDDDDDDDGSSSGMDDGQDDTAGWWSSPQRRRKNVSSETTVMDDDQAKQLVDLRKHLQDTLPDVEEAAGYDSTEE